MKKIADWFLRHLPLILGLAWIIIPDPVIGHIDDILIAVIEIATVTKQTINKFQSIQ